MKLIDKIKSGVDSTIKYIFRTDSELIIEMSYINKDDGKDIICVPTQTSCKMKCKFCHITDFTDQLRNRNLLAEEIVNGVNFIFYDLELFKTKRVLLVSYMGCGEPLLNYKEVIRSMELMQKHYKGLIPLVRFGIATSLPEHSQENFFLLSKLIYKKKLPVKIHLSLHYTNDGDRRQWMPNSAEILPSIIALEYYKALTKNSIEIHYALIDGVNDSETDAIALTEFIKGRYMPVKFLFYNEKPTLDFHASAKDKLKIFEKHFKVYDIPFEYYIPPGLDVGASCGQFLMDYYLKYNKKKESEEKKYFQS